MNCVECRDNLVARIEGLLEPEQERQCREHLESCAECRAEAAALGRLQQRLEAGGTTAAAVALVEPVMQRVRGAQTKPERMTFMKTLTNHRWGFGLGALASAAAVVVLLGVLAPSNVRAKAVDVLSRGAQVMAKLTSVHLRGQLRASPADNFGSISPDIGFCSIELWKQFEPEPKWRIEKPQRVIVMDGQSTVMLIRPGSTAVKLPQATPAAFDTGWLHRIADLSNTITNELKNALAHGWDLRLVEQNGADGRLKSIVTVQTKSGIPADDYVKNAFIDAADTRRVYRFDAQSGLLEAVQVYLVRPAGEVEIFELTQVDYNQPIATDTWNLQMPTDVSWAQLPQDLPRLPDNERYASMTAQQAARAFFEACGREDWTEAAKFMSPINDRVKKYLGGLELISLGEPFTSQAASGEFVPYEIKLRSQEFNVRVSNANAAGRYVITGLFDSQLKPQQELNWTNPPAQLPNNDTYSRLSPAEAVKSYFEAVARLDWDEMRKFAPDYDVEHDKAQIEAAQKQGMDVQKLLPKQEVVEAFWSAEQSSWFVKCRAWQVHKWNLGLRKDNPVGRWQVGGGI